MNNNYVTSNRPLKYITSKLQSQTWEPLMSIDEAKRYKWLSLVLRQLPRPRHPPTVIRPRPRTLELPVEHRPGLIQTNIK